MEDYDPRFADDAGAIEEWQAFLSDNRHLRFEDSPANWNCMFEFLKNHELFFNRESLHVAYVTLADSLELTPFAEPIYVEEQPEQLQSAAPSMPPAIPTRPSMTAWKNGKQIVVQPARPL